MREAVVVASSWTALAKAFRGSFNLSRPEDLAAHVSRRLGQNSKLAAKEIEDVVLGCAQPHGAQGQNIARISAMLAGLPASVAGRPSTVSALRSASYHGGGPQIS